MAALFLAFFRASSLSCWQRVLISSFKSIRPICRPVISRLSKKIEKSAEFSKKMQIPAKFCLRLLCLSSILPGMDWIFDLGLFLILSLCVVGTVVGVSRFRYRWWLCLLLFLLYLPYALISNFAPPEISDRLRADILREWSLGDILGFAFLVVFAACPARGVVDAVRPWIRWNKKSKESSDS